MVPRANAFGVVDNKTPHPTLSPREPAAQEGRGDKYSLAGRGGVYAGTAFGIPLIRPAAGKSGTALIDTANAWLPSWPEAGLYCDRGISDSKNLATKSEVGDS